MHPSKVLDVTVKLCARTKPVSVKLWYSIEFNRNCTVHKQNSSPYLLQTADDVNSSIQLINELLWPFHYAVMSIFAGCYKTESVEWLFKYTCSSPVSCLSLISYSLMKFTCEDYMAPECNKSVSAKKQYHFTVNSQHDGHILLV